MELSYKGTHYNGFQIQENANTIQSEIEKALSILYRKEIALTGSSRTDTGVHALQNYFHFDFDGDMNPRIVYKMNALLPADIAVKNFFLMPDQAHSRFDAISRAYHYRIHRFKNPFLESTSFFYPYKLDMDIMNQAAAYVKTQTNFFAFAKTNTQVKNFTCGIMESKWIIESDQLVYSIEANRFLRGMVRLLTASILKVGRHKISLEEFQNFFIGLEKCGYSVPPQGLFLRSVKFPSNYFPKPVEGFTAF